MPPSPSLADRFWMLLRRNSVAASALLHTLCETADEGGVELYAVGGLVRDLLLEDDPAARPLDLDLAVDAAPAPFHSIIAAAASAPLTIHARFGTAAAVLPDGAALDLARTRAEHYPAPAALPVVAPAPIATDLQRRDFTVNAAALILNGPRRGTLLDPYQAAADSARRRLRILHPASFQDDPTRLLRLTRYAARLNLTIDRRTRTHAVRDRSFLQQLSPARFGNAWRLLLQEPNHVEALQLARRLRLPQARHPQWTVPPRALLASQTPPHFWAAMGLLSPDPCIEAWLPQSVALQQAERAALTAGAALRRARRGLGLVRRPSTAAARLRSYPAPALEATEQLWDGPSGAATAAYLNRRSIVQSPISAPRLIELGIPPGPALGKWLQRLADLVWDGELDPADAAAVAAVEQQIRCTP